MVKHFLQVGVEGRIGEAKVDSAREVGVLERGTSRGPETMVRSLREYDTSR
jgi:hypothetical protein